MKVRELIEALKEFDPELEVCRSGYEGGYSFVSEVEKIKLVLDCNEEWYYGPHEDASDERTRADYPDNPRADAVYIS
jgi:hypothetical protein